MDYCVTFYIILLLRMVTFVRYCLSVSPIQNDKCLILILTLDIVNRCDHKALAAAQLENITKTLSRMIEGYDIRLRPNFGGKFDRDLFNLKLRTWFPLNVRHLSWSHQKMFHFVIRKWNWKGNRSPFSMPRIYLVRRRETRD